MYPGRDEPPVRRIPYLERGGILVSARGREKYVDAHEKHTSVRADTVRDPNEVVPFTIRSLAPLK